MSSTYIAQQLGLIITGCDRVIPVGGATASPQADATWRELLCLRMTSLAVWVMTQYRILTAIPSVLSPQPPTPDSPLMSLVHFALSARAQGKWLQMKFCVLSL